MRSRFHVLKIITFFNLKKLWINKTCDGLIKCHQLNSKILKILSKLTDFNRNLEDIVRWWKDAPEDLLNPVMSTFKEAGSEDLDKGQSITIAVVNEEVKMHSRRRVSVEDKCFP